jgi:hypothetical protein
LSFIFNNLLGSVCFVILLFAIPCKPGDPAARLYAKLSTKDAAGIVIHCILDGVVVRQVGQGEWPVLYKTRQIASGSNAPEGWKE